MSANQQRRYLLAYDIADDRRRTKVAAVLQAYGDRVQFSVFVVDVKPARLVRLQDQLRAKILESEDSVLICDLGPVDEARERRFRFMGGSRSVTDSGSFVV